MKILLTDDVVGLGDIGEMVDVKPGYARNFLIPRGMAVESESASVKQLAHRKRQIDAKKRRLKSDAQGLGRELTKERIELFLRVGAGGKVFGSVGVRDIASALADRGYSVDRRRVMLQEPIRRLGEHDVKVKLHADVVVMLKVLVSSKLASTEEEEQAVEQVRRSLEESSSTYSKEEEEVLESFEDGFIEGEEEEV